MRRPSLQWQRRLSSRISVTWSGLLSKASNATEHTLSEDEEQGDAAPSDAIKNPPSLQLPFELWIEILSYLDSAELANMARLCSPLRAEAEKLLYRSVSLTGYAIVFFHRTLSSSPYHASLVRRIDVFLHDDLDPRIPACLAETLSLQLPLQYLSILCSPNATWEYMIIHYCKLIFCRRFPDLRGFRTNVPQLTFAGLLDFIAAHSALEELHLEMSDSRLPPSLAVSPYIRTLTCMPRFVKGKLLAGKLRELTHLYLGRFSYGDLKVLSETLGSQLVSLRLGTQVNASPIRPWTIGDIATKLPRLRFIHVDMGMHVRGPGMHARPIDWQSKTTDEKRAPLPSNQLTIVWAYPHDDGVVLSSAAAWHTFLNKAVYDVLLQWAPYVRRIVYRHTIIPYLSATLNQDQTRLVKTQDPRMSDDYWKSV